MAHSRFNNFLNHLCYNAPIYKGTNMKYTDLIKELEKYSLDQLVGLLPNNLKAVEEYEQNSFNIFKTINMRENSHTNLLAWLLNINNNRNKVNKNTIQYYFVYNFIEFLNDNGYIENIGNLEQYVENLCTDLCVETQHNDIDLLIYSLKQNFICVIENKLDAKICIETDNKTQLEKYRDYIEDYFIKEKFNNINKLNQKRYFFLNRGQSSKNKRVHLSKGKSISNEEFQELLDKLGYKTIEYSDIVLIIHKTLKHFWNDFSKTMITEDNILEVLKSIKKHYNRDNKNNQILELILKNFNYKEQIQKKLRNFNIDIGKILNNFLQDGKINLVLVILNQYVEYWEYHAKFVDGYSKITDVMVGSKIYGIYIWDIKKILEEKSKAM